MRKTLAILNALIENSPDLICARDRDGGLIFWNDAFAASCRESLGIEVRVGLRTVEYIPPEALAQLASVREAYQQAWEGETQQTEFSYTWLNGETHLYEITWTPVRDGDETIAVAEVSRDITARKLAEERLRRSRERFVSLLRSSDDPVWCLEVEPPFSIDLPEDDQVRLLMERVCFSEANDAFARQLGLSTWRDVIGIRLRDFLSVSEPENEQALRLLIRAEYTLWGFETIERHAGREGITRIWNNSVGVVEDGMMLRAWGVSRELGRETEYKRRARSLTPRERQVLDLVVAGRMNKQIAAELGISEKTVKVHRGRVMEKMGAQSLAHLVRMSVQLADPG